MAGRKPVGGQRNRLAVVLTGSAARAAAQLGALEALDAAGLSPQVVVGAGGGAIMAALYACSESAEQARGALYATAESASWQDFADVDYGAVVKLLSAPYEVPGLVRGEALQRALLDSPIGHLGFQHLETELFIVASDLNSGREVVFGNQTAESAPKATYRLFAKGDEDLARTNIATAVRASNLVPGLCRPLDLDHLALVDGSLRARKALEVAASQKGVKRVLWLHAGLDDNDTFSLVTDYYGQSFAAGLTHALTVAGADQFDPHTGDPLLDGVAVRYLNLATATVGSFDLTRTQQVYESGRRTIQALCAVEPVEGGKGLFSADAGELERALLAVKDEQGEGRWRVTVGAGGRDVISITDAMPTLQQEFGYEFEEYLTKAGLDKLARHDPANSAAWAMAGAEAELGLGGLVWLYFSRFCGVAWKALWLGLRTAAQALRADRLWTAVTRRVGEAGLAVGDAFAQRRGGAG